MNTLTVKLVRHELMESRGHKLNKHANLLAVKLVHHQLADHCRDFSVDTHGRVSTEARMECHGQSCLALHKRRRADAWKTLEDVVYQHASICRGVLSYIILEPARTVTTPQCLHRACPKRIAVADLAHFGPVEAHLQMGVIEIFVKPDILDDVKVIFHCDVDHHSAWMTGRHFQAYLVSDVLLQHLKIRRIVLIERD